LPITIGIEGRRSHCLNYRSNCDRDQSTFKFGIYIPVLSSMVTTVASARDLGE